jgi:hypothetical protein
MLHRLPLRWLAAGAAASVALDVWLDRRDAPLPSLPVLAALDWSAHLVATALALRALPARVAEPLAAPALVASVALDADHLPIAAAMARGADDLPRPRPHTFAVPALLGALRRPGAAFGTAVHLARDLFNGPGVAVAWPASSRLLRLPVAVEALVLGGLLATAAARAGNTSRPPGVSSGDDPA